MAGTVWLDLGALGDQESPFGSVASASTAFRLVDRIARDPDGLERLREAHAEARAGVWKLAGAPERLTIDLDATLVGSHSEKEGAAGNFMGGYGFHPMLAYADETSEALAGELRPGNAGANTAWPTRSRSLSRRLGRSPPGTSRASSCCCAWIPRGSSHAAVGLGSRGLEIEFSVGYELNEAARTAILQIP